MTDRLKALKRIRAVQGQIKRLADMRLATAERRKAEVAAAFADLETFMDDGAPVGDLARLAMWQKRRLALRGAEAEVERVSQAGKVVEAQTRLKLTERRVEELDLAARRQAERRDLQHLLDAFLARDGAPD